VAYAIEKTSLYLSRGKVVIGFVNRHSKIASKIIVSPEVANSFRCAVRLAVPFAIPT